MTENDRIRHDFKNQLAIIRGFAEVLLASTEPGDPLRRDLEEIHKAAVTSLDMLVSVFPESEAGPSPPS
jgi:signal transduction histidine kinase